MIATRRGEAPGFQNAFQEAKSSWNAAKTSVHRRRRTGNAGMGSHADYHYRSDGDYLRMMELARDYRRNDVVVGQGTRRLVDNVLNGGFTLAPSTVVEDFNQRIWAKWMRWAEDPRLCDVQSERSLHGLGRLALEQTIVDGDIFFAGLDSGELQAFEAHRVRTPRNAVAKNAAGQPRRNIVHGVELDIYRRERRYWVTKEDIDPEQPLHNVGDARAFDVWDDDNDRQAFHVYFPQRMSQTRGVTAYAPIVDVAGMHDDIQFARMVQQQIVSCFGFIRQLKPQTFAGGANGRSGVGDVAIGSRSSDSRTDGTSRVMESIEPGQMYTATEFEELKAFSPGVPPAEFFNHANLLLTFIAINLDLPLAVLLLDPSNTNFSGWRGAIDQARQSYRRIQRDLIERFYSPVYRFKVKQFCADDPTLQALFDQIIAAGGDPFAHSFKPPAWRYIQPVEDASGDLLQMRNLLSSPRRIHGDRSQDWETVADETVQDNAYVIRAAKKLAKAINTEFAEDPKPVSWTDLISLPTPDSVRASVVLGGSASEPTATASPSRQPQEANAE